jgi:hypothetical protein
MAFNRHRKRCLGARPDGRRRKRRLGRETRGQKLL